MICLKVSIQRPGLGRTFSVCGKADNSRYGAERPNATKLKTMEDWTAGKVSADPSAGARKGALQGAATTVANTPVKNDPLYPFLCCRFEPVPVRKMPNSKTPLRLSPNIIM